MEKSGHVDSFARDNLPPQAQWPHFLLDRPEFAYPPRFNCAVSFLDDMVAKGFGPRDCKIGIEQCQ